MTTTTSTIKVITTLSFQYIRLAHDTKSENVMALFKRQWKVELPKLVISVHGGIANFDLQPKLKRMFRKGMFLEA